MKKLLAVLAIAVLTAVQGQTQSITTNTPSNWSFSAGTLLMTTYYGTIFGGNFYDGPLVFADITANWKNRFGVLVPTIMAGQKLDRLNTYNADGGNEYDIGVDQIFTFGTKAYPIIVDVGIMYLAVTDLTQLRDDFFDETIRVDLPIRADRPDGPIITPYAQIYHYHTMGNDMQDQGWIGYFGLIRDQKLGIELFGEELKLNIDYRCGVNFGVLNSDVGIEYNRLALSLPIKYGKWTFTPSVIGQLQGDSDQTWVKKNEVFGTLSIRYSF